MQHQDDDEATDCERVFFRNIVRQISNQSVYDPLFFLQLRYKDQQMMEEMSATPFLLKQMTGIDSIINSTMRSHPLILRRLMNLYDSNPPDKESMLQVFKSNFCSKAI